MTQLPTTSTNEDKNDEFRRVLANTIIAVIRSYDAAMKSDFADVASIKASRSGNFTDPQTGNEYGFTFTVGNADFFEEGEQQDDEEEYEDD